METLNSLGIHMDKLTSVIPEILTAMVLLSGGVIAAFLFRRMTFFLLSRMGRLNNPRLAMLAKSGYTNAFAKTISKMIFWSALIVSGSTVLQVFGVDIISEWMKRITEFLPNVFGAGFVAVSGFLIARLSRDFLRETASFAHIGMKRSVPSFLYYSICAVSILIAVEQLGIDVGFLTSVILVFLLCILAGGAISFGIGSAPIVTNLLSSYYIRKRVKVGQMLSTSEFSGIVVEIGPTCVFLKGEQGIESIPSRQLNELRFVVKNAAG